MKINDVSSGSSGLNFNNSRSTYTHQIDEVTFEIYPKLSKSDLDYLLIYLQHCGGGDVLNLSLLKESNFLFRNTKKFSLTFADSEAKKRILEKKFFKFKHYYLRSAGSCVNGYKKDEYDYLKSKLVISNLVGDDGKFERMYAENLLRGNDVVNIKKSSIFANTFYVSYKNEIDLENLNSRFKLQSFIKNKHVHCLRSYNTKAFIISSKGKLKPKQINDLNKVKTKVKEEISKLSKNESTGYFIDQTEEYLLFQLDNESYVNDLINSVRFFIGKNSMDLAVEYCYNFNLFGDRFTKDLIPEDTNIKSDCEKLDLRSYKLESSSKHEGLLDISLVKTCSNINQIKDNKFGSFKTIAIALIRTLKKHFEPFQNDDYLAFLGHNFKQINIFALKKISRALKEIFDDDFEIMVSGKVEFDLSNRNDFFEVEFTRCGVKELIVRYFCSSGNFNSSGDIFITANKKPKINRRLEKVSKENSKN